MLPRETREGRDVERLESQLLGIKRIRRVRV